VKIAEVLKALQDLQEAGVLENYAIGGAVGAAFFLEPTATVDVAVFVQLSNQEDRVLLDPSPLFAFLKERGHDLVGEYVVIGGWPVQFLAPPGPLGEEALSHAIEVDVEGVPVKTLGPEYLAAICLQTGRAKDKARLLQFFEEEAVDLPRFLDVVGRHGLTNLWLQFQKEFLDDGS